MSKIIVQKPLKPAQKTILLHILGDQVMASRVQECEGLLVFRARLGHDVTSPN